MSYCEDELVGGLRPSSRATRHHGYNAKIGAPTRPRCVMIRHFGAYVLTPRQP